MADQLYGLPEMRQLLSGRHTHHPDFEPFFLTRAPPPPPPPPPQSDSLTLCDPPSNFVIQNGYYTKLDQLYSAGVPTPNIPASASLPGDANRSSLGGAEMENGWTENGYGCSNTSRWPRQETLTLLEIRSRLDPSFKEANQKAPLWDEVSRIMAEEYGYHRSGRKCREKFENLYKYYKKTKEGKGGRQDGKQYRFFRQLEAIYGEASNHSSSFQHYLAPQNDTVLNYKAISCNKMSANESLSFSNTSEFEASSSENRSEGKHKGLKSGRKGWKVKIKDYVDVKMRKMMAAQDFWMERLLKIVEDKETERKCRQEEWMKKEEDRLDKEQEMWTKERAWMEARDAALIDALKKHAGKGLLKHLPLSIEHMALSTHRRCQEKWSETEIMSLAQLRTAMEPKFENLSGTSKETLWEEIAVKMAASGYHRSSEECHQKWETMNLYFSMNEGSKRQVDGAFWGVPIFSGNQTL